MFGRVRNELILDHSLKIEYNLAIPKLCETCPSHSEFNCHMFCDFFSTHLRACFHFQRGEVPSDTGHVSFLLSSLPPIKPFSYSHFGTNLCRIKKKSLSIKSAVPTVVILSYLEKDFFSDRRAFPYFNRGFNLLVILKLGETSIDSSSRSISCRLYQWC